MEAKATVLHNLVWKTVPPAHSLATTPPCSSRVCTFVTNALLRFEHVYRLRDDDVLCHTQQICTLFTRRKSSLLAAGVAVAHGIVDSFTKRGYLLFTVRVWVFNEDLLRGTSKAIKSTRCRYVEERCCRDWLNHIASAKKRHRHNGWGRHSVLPTFRWRHTSDSVVEKEEGGLA